MKEIIMAFQGEMALKGLNRATFESTLMKITRRRLEHLGDFKVYRAQSTMYVEPKDEFADMDLAFEKVSRIFGIAALCRAAVCEKDFEAICAATLDYLGD